MAKASELSSKQRTEAVLALLRREEPGTVLARRFGVSEPTLYRWRDEFLAAGEAALGSRKSAGEPKARQIAELEKQIAKRDQVIGELTIANRVLKKYADTSN
jgi:transposase